ncbi:MAG: hypothetical protein ABIF10_07060 [Candidatus Woesearchaeota archaeon]
MNLSFSGCRQQTRELQKQTGFTTRQLADSLGVKQCNLVEWLQAANAPKKKKIDKKLSAHSGHKPLILLSGL